MKEELVTTVFSLLTLLVTWLGLQLRSWLAAKIKNEKARGILERLDDFIEASVKEVEQATLSSLTDVKPGDLVAAKNAAIAAVKSHLGSKGIGELMAVLGLKEDGAAEKFIATQLEAKVFDLKSMGFLPARTPATP